MNKAQAKIAIDALRSTEYEQARDSIGSYHSNVLCCIGVAAKANGAPYFGVTASAAEYINLLPSQRGAMVEMNDNEGKTFSEIADWMEQQEWTE